MNVPSSRHVPLIGEPVALDLVNTRVHTATGDADLLDTPAALYAWLAREDSRLPQPDRSLTPGDLAAVRAVREHVATAVEHARHGRPPPARTLQVLTEAQRQGAAYSELGWDGATVIVKPQRVGSYPTRLAAELSHAAAELVTDPAITKVRQCEGPGCVLLFLPAHPRRRWCAPDLCGNRFRVARYYQRHRRP